MLTISGIFSVTFSIVFAYVADVTTEEDRSAAYGLVMLHFHLFSVKKHAWLQTVSPKLSPTHKLTQ